MTEIPVPKQFEKFIHAVSALQQAIDPASKPPVVSADETEVNLEFTDQLVIKGLSRVTAQVVDRALERNGLGGIDYSPTSQENQEVTAILSYPGGNHPDAARLEKATKLINTATAASKAGIPAQDLEEAISAPQPTTQEVITTLNASLQGLTPADQIAEFRKVIAGADIPEQFKKGLERASGIRPEPAGHSRGGGGSEVLNAS